MADALAAVRRVRRLLFGRLLCVLNLLNTVLFAAHAKHLKRIACQNEQAYEHQK